MITNYIYYMPKRKSNRKPSQKQNDIPPVANKIADDAIKLALDSKESSVISSETIKGAELITAVSEDLMAASKFDELHKQVLKDIVSIKKPTLDSKESSVISSQTIEGPELITGVSEDLNKIAASKIFAPHKERINKAASKLLELVKDLGKSAKQVFTDAATQMENLMTEIKDFTKSTTKELNVAFKETQKYFTEQLTQKVENLKNIFTDAAKSCNKSITLATVRVKKVFAQEKSIERVIDKGRGI
jgi:hypothetical protein